jgi:prophage tail gpP-like protein
LADQWKSNSVVSARELDTVLVENPEIGAFETFNSLAITNDLTRPSEAAFEIGDDSTYNSLITSAVRMGSPFSVWVNDRLHLTGRVELIGAPISADQGVPMTFVVRTKLADAMYASANPNIRASKGTTIRDFILALFEPLGYVSSDFVLRADLSRDLLTGKSSSGQDSPIALESIKEEQLKVNPPETIYAAADRVLRRHGLMLWDAPDGKIVIGFPNDDQSPLYTFRMFNDSRSNQNNILSAQRSNDFSSAPSVLAVMGTSGKQNWRNAKVGNIQVQKAVDDIFNKDGSRPFYRPVLLLNEGLKNDALAERFARREMTNRSKAIDTWDVEVDGLSFWNGSELVPYGIDTVATIETSLAGGPAGAYLVTSVAKTRNADNGDSTRLQLLKKGLWVL